MRDRPAATRTALDQRTMQHHRRPALAALGDSPDQAGRTNPP